MFLRASSLVAPEVAAPMLSSAGHQACQAMYQLETLLSEVRLPVDCAAAQGQATGSLPAALPALQLKSVNLGRYDGGRDERNWLQGRNCSWLMVTGPGHRSFAFCQPLFPARSRVYREVRSLGRGKLSAEAGAASVDPGYYVVVNKHGRNLSPSWSRYVIPGRCPNGAGPTRKA